MSDISGFDSEMPIRDLIVDFELRKLAEKDQEMWHVALQNALRRADNPEGALPRPPPSGHCHVNTESPIYS